MYAVDYKIVDGAHWFTSAHPDLIGLNAASNDLKLAYDDVAVQIEELLRINHGRNEKYVPLWSIKKFLRESCGQAITGYWKKL